VEVRRPASPRAAAGSAGAAAGPHVDPQALRVRERSATQLLRGGDLEGRTPAAQREGADLERHVEERVLTTTLDRAVAWARSNSFFPATFGLACCAIEMMSIVAARVDVARFGFEAFRASPRQADLLILSGRVSIKMAPIVRRIYDQMLEPKWAISMGACCSSMGVFNNYALVPADKFMPVDVHVPGCPPRPEALMHGVLKLRKMVQDDPDMGWRDRYGARGTEENLPQTGKPAAVGVPLGGDTAGA
jgi:NADH-quinone oxidoreductase subunit B